MLRYATTSFERVALRSRLWTTLRYNSHIHLQTSSNVFPTLLVLAQVSSSKGGRRWGTKKAEDIQQCLGKPAELSPLSKVCLTSFHQRFASAEPFEVCDICSKAADAGCFAENWRSSSSNGRLHRTPMQLRQGGK